MLTNTRIVLDFLWQVDDSASYGDEEGRGWFLGLDVWEDMGRPEKITISISPGDLLNGDSE